MTTWFDIRRICPAAGFVLFLLTSFAYAAAAAAEPKRVMLLHSFGRDFKPWSEYAKSIRAELDRQSPWRLDITDHSLVSARSSDEDPEAPFVEYLRALFAKQPLDLIVGEPRGLLGNGARGRCGQSSDHERGPSHETSCL